jgi:hypothetical protein
MYAALFHRPAPCSRTQSDILKPLLVKKIGSEPYRRITAKRWQDGGFFITQKIDL